MKNTLKNDFLSSRVRYIPLEHIVPNPHQPRRDFDPAALAELADSIRQYGVLQPATVRTRGRDYELVAGERRFRAAKLAGLKELPCLIAQVGEEDSALLALMENLQRRDLNYMEEAADADDVVILDHGKIAAEGTPLSLKNTYTADYITLYGVQEQQVQALGRHYEALRDAYRVTVPNTAAATELIVKHPALFRDYEITKGKMDDVFLAVTGKTLPGGAEK